ncbi:MAG: hypothetical protein ABSB94_15565 [Syntrophorhabdales bacterium]
MKRIGLFAVGFILAIGLLVGGPGVARATPVNAFEIIDNGASITSISGNLYTATERSNDWALSGYDATGNQIGGNVTITLGTLVFNNATGAATFSGDIGGTPFTVTGTVNNFKTTSVGKVQNYGWLLQIPDASALSNSQFNVTGAYSGSVSFLQTAAHPVSGFSSVGLDVTSAVPLPPSMLLFAPGLLGLIGIRKRFKA